MDRFTYKKQTIMSKAEEFLTAKDRYYAFKKYWSKRITITVASKIKFGQDLDDLLEQYAAEVSREIYDKGLFDGVEMVRKSLISQEQEKQ